MERSQHFTTHQLRILVHLLTSRSVTTTAHAFETSQPAVSRLLADMRRKFNDPLLIRGHDGMVVSDRGRVIRDEVEQILDRMGKLVNPQDTFDPEASDRSFSLGFTDSNMVTLVPPVVRTIKKAGPRLRSVIRPIDPAFDVVGALEQRVLDVVIDCVSEFTRDTYETLRHVPLGSDDVVLLVRQGHAVVDNPPRTAEDYLELLHVAPFPVSNTEKGPIDGALAAQKIPRQVQCYVPEFNIIPHVLVDSNLVFTTCREFANHFARCLPLSVVPAPEIFPRMEFRLLWHEVTHRSPAEVWLRKQIQSAAVLGKSAETSGN